MKRLRTKVTALVMAGALVAGMMPAVAMAAEENEPVTLADVAYSEYEACGIYAYDDETWDFVPVGDAVMFNYGYAQVFAEIVYTTYDAGGDVIDSTDDVDDIYEALENDGARIEWSVISTPDNCNYCEVELEELDPDLTIYPFINFDVSGDYVIHYSLYSADDDLLGEAEDTLHVIDDPDVYYLTLETETTEVHVGDEVEVRAHITRGGEDITDLAAEPLAINWYNFSEADAYHIGGQYAALEDGLTGAEFLDAEFSGLPGEIYGAQLELEFGSYDPECSWACTQSSDTVTVTFPEPGVYYITADCGVYAEAYEWEEWDGVLENEYWVDPRAKMWSEQDMDTIRFVVTETEAEDEPEIIEDTEPAEPEDDESVPTADAYTAFYIACIIVLAALLVAFIILLVKSREEKNGRGRKEDAE